MGLRFRLSRKIASGITLSLGKRGGSVRLGGKGFGYTVGNSGKRVTAGIPGTGLSYTSEIGSQKSSDRGRWGPIVLTFVIIAIIAFVAAKK